MKNPFKKSSASMKQKPGEALSDIQFVAQMQRKLDAYEEFVSRTLSYIINPHGINEDSPAGLTHDIPEAKYPFRFLLWIKQNQPDIFERFLKDEFRHNSNDDSESE